MVGFFDFFFLHMMMTATMAITRAWNTTTPSDTPNAIATVLLLPVLCRGTADVVVRGESGGGGGGARPVQGGVLGRGMGEGRRRREKGEKGGGGKEEWGKGG